MWRVLFLGLNMVIKLKISTLEREKSEMTVLSHQTLYALINGECPMIHGDNLFPQPASIDCPLGNRIFRMPFSMLPRSGETVDGLVSRMLFDRELTERPFLLEQGVTYVVPLAVELSLSKHFFGEFSPKSSTGRNDVLVRVLSDRFSRFDVIARGYSGKLYLEITPLSYPVQITSGLALTQMRIKDQEILLTNTELVALHAQYGIVRNSKGRPLSHDEIVVRQNSLTLHADLSGIAGFASVAHPTRDVNLSLVEKRDPKDFWQPVFAHNGELILSPGRFYLLKSKERVRIPPECCAQMHIYDPGSGDFRSHYAGFFDNGFGGETGTVAVFEFRGRDVPFRICDGQPLCRMSFEATDYVPKILYGGSDSHYTSSGASLAKHFKDRALAWRDSNYWK